MTIHHNEGYRLNEGPLGIKWALEAEPGNETVSRLLQLTPSLNYSNEKCVSWIKDQLEICQHHEHAVVDPNFLPERLLQVPPDSGDKPRLVSSKDIKALPDRQPLKYAALSYCWGSMEEAQSQLTLTQASMEERCQGINNEELSPALQDAVTMIRTLGLPYLWVDALCILQDDASDWQRQCVDMHKIYGNAFITLCAAGSTSCRQGFLEQPQPCRQISMPFDSCRHGISGSYCLHFKEIDTHYRRELRRGHDPRFDDLRFSSPWASRGWVFQERISSVRSLAFGRLGLHFLCSHRQSTMDRPDLDYISSHPLKYPAAPDFRLYRPTKATERGLFNAWMILLMEYGRLPLQSFTNPTDVLPAISGLAALYHRGLEESIGEKLTVREEYIAGYWRRDLFRSLHWGLMHHLINSDNAKGSKAEHLEFLDRITNQYSLPSWSHLARGAVSSIFFKFDLFFSGHYEPDYEVLRPHANVSVGNPFGTVQSCRLEIKTNIIDLATLEKSKLTIMAGDRYDTRFSVSYEGERLCEMDMDINYLDWKPFLEVERDLRELRVQELYKDISSFQLALLGRYVVDDDAVQLKLQSAHQPNEDKELEPPGNYMGPTGLILHRIPNSDDFYRVGMFRPFVRQRRQRSLLRFKSLSEVGTVFVG